MSLRKQITNPTPGVGDSVDIDAGGRVVEIQVRGGVIGALVELDEFENHVWLPLDALVVREPVANHDRLRATA
ncbi:MAG: hypothetical protein QOF00_1301 [Pseudonocardiales bacterium]|jgi:hypothetical protein|nr:hypothetical protein [Pseudonocardiales bacterium]